MRRFGWHGQMTFVSSLTLLMPSPACRLLPRLRAIILRIIETFRFRVNLGAGKTEALVHLVGAGAAQAREELLFQTAGQSGSSRNINTFVFLSVLRTLAEGTLKLLSGEVLQIELSRLGLSTPSFFPGLSCSFGSACLATPLFPVRVLVGPFLGCSALLAPPLPCTGHAMTFMHRSEVKFRV